MNIEMMKKSVSVSDDIGVCVGILRDEPLATAAMEIGDGRKRERNNTGSYVER